MLVNRRHIEFTGEQVGFFGFFESVREPEVAAALMAAAEDNMRGRGMPAIRGPFNFSTNEECGMLVEGFDEPPVFMMPYNPRYYPDFMTDLGYRKAKDLWAYDYRYPGEIPPHMVRFSRSVEERMNADLLDIFLTRLFIW